MMTRSRSLDRSSLQNPFVPRSSLRQESVSLLRHSYNFLHMENRVVRPQCLDVRGNGMSNGERRSINRVYELSWQVFYEQVIWLNHRAVDERIRRLHLLVAFLRGRNFCNLIVFKVIDFYLAV